MHMEIMEAARRASSITNHKTHPRAMADHPLLPAVQHDVVTMTERRGGSSSTTNGVGFQIDDVNITNRNQPRYHELAKVAHLGNGPHALPTIMTVNPLNQQQQHHASHAAAGSTNYHVSNMALISASQPQQPYAQSYPQQHPQLDVREAWDCFQQHCAEQHQRQLHHLKLHQHRQMLRGPHEVEGSQLRFMLQQKQGQDEASILQKWQKQNTPQQQQMLLATEYHRQQMELEQLVQQKRALEMQQLKVQMEEERKEEQLVKQKRAFEVEQQRAQMEDGWKRQIEEERKCQERKFQEQQQSFEETFRAAQLLCTTKAGDWSKTDLVVASTLPNLWSMPTVASPQLLPTNNVGLSSPPRTSNKLPTDVRLSPPPSPCAPGDVGWAWSAWTGSDETDLLSCDEAKVTEDDGQQEMNGGEVQSRLLKPHSNHISVGDSSASTGEYVSYPEIPRKGEIPLSFMASSSVHHGGNLSRPSTVALPPSIPHSLHPSVIDRQRKLKGLSQSAITTSAHTLEPASKTNIGRSTRTPINKKRAATSKHVAPNQRLSSTITLPRQIMEKDQQHRQGEQFSTLTTLTAKKTLSPKERKMKAASVPKRSTSPTIAQLVAVSKKKSLPLSSNLVEARTVSESSRSRLDLSDILSLSDDSTGYAAAETCQSNKKSSRSAVDKDESANDIPHEVDIDGTNYDNEFVDDLPDCISWNHNKKRYIDRDGLAILATTVKDRDDASTPSLMAISVDRTPPKECGRQNCWFDLHRVEGPTRVAGSTSSSDKCESIQKGENTIANINKGKLKSIDSALSQSSSPAPTTSESDRLTKKKKQTMSTDDQSFTKKKKTKKAMGNLLSSSNPSSPSPKSFTLPAPKSQSGCEARVFKDGKRVFAPWFGKAGSSLRVYYFPAVVMSHKLVQKGEDLGAVVLYDVRFDDDGVLKDDIQGSLVISRKKYLKRNLKPMLSVGDEVYAAWWEDSKNRTSAPSWFPGVVKAYKDLGYGGRHGLIRLYDITYDDGDELKSIEDYLVMKKDDYLITNSKVTEDGNVESTWLGVTNKVDETSIDRWANQIGWYVATIDGQDQSFSCLTDALRAYDAFVVSCKGDQTKKTDLNLPQEWAFPTPIGICAPVHVSGEHISAGDMCAVKDEHTIRRRESDFDIASQGSFLDIASRGSFDRKQISKSKSNLVNSPNHAGSNKDHLTKRKTASSSTAMAINLSINAPAYTEPITESTSSSLDVRCITDDSIKLHYTNTLTSMGDTTQSALTSIDDPSLTTEIISVKTSVADQPKLHPTLNGRFVKYPAFPANGLPPNWTMRKIPRNETSDHQKAFDIYYFSPKMSYRFRSRKEVKRYLSYLDRENGDEVKAIQMFHSKRNESHQKSISDDSSRLTSSTTMSVPCCNESRHRVVEIIKPSKSKSFDTDTSDEPYDPTTPTGYIKPIIKKGEKVYACWSGPNGDGKVFFPGRVWDVRDSGVSSEYGPVMMYDIVYDDGDTESDVHEIWVIKKEEWEMYHRKPEESWIGVTNVTFPTSEDNYANTLGWYKLSSSTFVDMKNTPVYSSLGDALRAHDRHVIEIKGQDNVTAKELNFPEEHGLVNQSLI